MEKIYTWRSWHVAAFRSDLFCVFICSQSVAIITVVLASWISDLCTFWLFYFKICLLPNTFSFHSGWKYLLIILPNNLPVTRTDLFNSCLDKDGSDWHEQANGDWCEPAMSGHLMTSHPIRSLVTKSFFLSPSHNPCLLLSCLVSLSFSCYSASVTLQQTSPTWRFCCP